MITSTLTRIDLNLNDHLERVRATLDRLDPQEAWLALRQGALLVDTRPEFQRRRDGEIPGAIVIERNHLEWRLHPESDGRINEATDAGTRWIIVCDEGYASSLAAASLRAIGLHRATDVIGGFQAWRAADLPVQPAGEASPPRLPDVTPQLGSLAPNVRRASRR